jgi:hypothetical protein
MTAPKPTVTNHNQVHLVTLDCAEKQRRNQRNHSLKGEGDLVTPLARSTLLRSRHSSAALRLGLRLLAGRSPR